MTNNSQNRNDSQIRRWIFLRGLARHSGHWDFFLDEFKKQYPIDEVELLDTAGNGNQGDRESFIKISEYVDDLRQRSKFIQELHNKKTNIKPILFTISLGSMIAVDWAQRFSDELSGFVIINTSDRSTSAFYERLRPQNYSYFLQLALNGKNSLFRERVISKMTASGLRNATEVIEKFSQLPATNFSNFVKQIFAASNFNFPEQKPAVPCLILASKNDQMVNSVCSERIGKMWHTPVYFHPNAGHDLPLWDPAWICSHLQRFFQ